MGENHEHEGGCGGIFHNFLHWVKSYDNLVEPSPHKFHFNNDTKIKTILG